MFATYARNGLQNASTHGTPGQQIPEKTYYSAVRALEVEIEDSLKAEQARDEASGMHLPAEVV